MTDYHRESEACEFCQQPCETADGDPIGLIVCTTCWNRANEGSGWMQRALNAETQAAECAAQIAALRGQLQQLVNYYITLPYTKVLERDDDGDVVGTIAELDGCMAHGRDEAEAVRNLHAAQRAWLEAALSSGQIVPVP
jgi:predicted RNase H-like HicB family nuclease